MPQTEGLWTVSFQSNFQTVGTGVVVFVRDRLLGGDAFYYYDGNATINVDKLEAVIKVVRFNRAGMAIFGNLDSFSLKVEGELSATSMTLRGYMVEQPNMKITISCQKISNI
jgi:hypothetical protein